MLCGASPFGRSDLIVAQPVAVHPGDTLLPSSRTDFGLSVLILTLSTSQANLNATQECVSWTIYATPHVSAS